MLKHNRSLIYGLIAVVILIFIFIISKPIYGNCSENRQKIINNHKKGTIVISETEIENIIICEIEDKHNMYGFAVFSPDEKENLRFQTRVSTPKDQNILTTHIRINNEQYEFYMCNKANLSYAEVIYTDIYPNQDIPTKKLDVTNGKYAYTKSPNVKSYSRYIAFYDNNGKKYN